MITKVQQALKDNGIYFGKIDLGTQDISSGLLNFVKLIGTPSEHNIGKRDYVWTIKAQKEPRTLHTYSEHNYPASLHTDSQYRINPEQFLLIYVEKAAQCGGGKFLFLEAKVVWGELQAAFGTKLFQDLFQLEFPFAVPDVFIPANDSQNFILAPLLHSPSKLRYRRNTILAGMDRCPSLFTEHRVQIIKTFHDIIHSSKRVQSVYLKPGSFVILDNYRYLHGREAFSDLSRTLFRVRFNALKKK